MLWTIIAAIALIVIIFRTWVSISKSVNRRSPFGQAIFNAAGKSGYNRGSAEDADRFTSTFTWMTQHLPTPIPNQQAVAATLARETVDSRYPIAVDAAWAAASLLPFYALKEFASIAGHNGYVQIASVFDAVFPGKRYTNVLGEKVVTKVLSCAVAAVLLEEYAEELNAVTDAPDR